jgi:TRAP-type mannitol/chloroaromatic compound transport system permease small subunit
MNALASFARLVQCLNELVGRAVAWLMLAMVLVAFLVVTLRYGFSLGWVWMQESYVWMHGLVFTLGAGYTLLHDGHVRVDILYRAAGTRYRALVDLLGSPFLLLPLVCVVAWVSLPYVASSWAKLERSGEAGGLPGLYLLKAALLAFCLLLGLQALAMACRSILHLAGREPPSLAGERAEPW